MRPVALTFAAAACLFASAALTQETPPVLVSDPAMCDMIKRGDDVQEVGMILTAEGMYEIEYHCEFATPLDLVWSVDTMQVRAGYCAAPGEVMPTVFAIHTSDHDPNVVTIWEQGVDEATVFQRCWGL